MTARELIIELQKYDSELPVVYYDSEQGEWNVEDLQFLKKSIFRERDCLRLL